VRYVLHFKSHGQTATVVAKHEHLDVVDQNNAGRIPLNQYLLDYHRQSGLTACHRIRCVCVCVCVCVLQGHLISPRPYCVLYAFYGRLTKRFTTVTNQNADKCVNQSDSEVHLEN